MVPLLTRIVSTSIHDREERAMPDHMDMENRIAGDEDSLKAGIERFGEPSTYGCPECHGVLRQVAEGGRIRFRCHTGHAYSADALAGALHEAVEDSLWSAIRALEETGMLMRHLVRHAEDARDAAGAAAFKKEAEHAHRQAVALREMVRRREPTGLTLE
jgi:two-component system chemotaxis response regulator CheB